MIKTTLLTLLGLVVLAIAVVAVIALQRPDTFRVSRSTSIAAPAEKIFPLVNDVRAFNTWNPYALKAPEMKGSYSGPFIGPGAHYDFESKKSGSGSFEIVQAVAPSQVQMRLDMTAPFKTQNVITFTMVPLGAATQTTWAMEGPASFLSKFMGVIFNMDKMIGTDFDAGLAKLKARAEQA
ncbi:MAG: SRPBCC family protein [Polaromonas sp.]|uniref:SRPBCC family protein n=1 Tax=Polaromonas sp. TaxID=1869339 RepID=UPI002727D2DF|nr:SRPBCC family protein [Polaromonas sp.]MDO9112984.1 SRPBCC family protein [Polaromonas sp.]MDP1886050.1 SRPBCC family protein [Polaromonas sp.]